MYVVFWSSSLLVGKCCVQLHLEDLVGIILFVSSICCMLCCLVGSIGIDRFGMFW